MPADRDTAPDSAIEVRELTTDADRAAAVPVLHELFTDHERSEFRAFFDDPAYTALGAFAGGSDAGDGEDQELVGVVGLSVQGALHHERHAWVHDLVVTAEERGNGYGARLLDATEDWAREQGCDLVALAVRDGNGAAEEFYDAEGYEQWGAVYERRLG